MKLLNVARAVVLVALSAASAAAQVQVRITSVNPPGGTSTIWDPPGTTFGAFYVSPYGGTIVGSGRSLVLNCVDFFHEVSIGQTYWANQTYLDNSSLTNSRFNNLEWYLQAAWLTQQYSTPDPGSNDDRRIAIQAAMWNIFTPAAPDRDITGTSYDSQTWLDRARLAANWQSIDKSKFFLLTPTNKQYASSAQEFLVYDPSHVTAAPEPATLILLSSGMAGLAAARRRRKNKGVPIATA